MIIKVKFIYSINISLRGYFIAKLFLNQNPKKISIEIKIRKKIKKLINIILNKSKNLDKLPLI